ncbi:TetR/AcrR family transcriptional regulator [Spirochaeta africana]|uniref:Transcriptional regulator n=1 Tax=Spirochaeta africana (strain ATCC 700263 / DSM 8902 / Z-7692) TaxID=889378 RepID=H9UFV4_SPIAZ|nr:TetR/AcrR family transcriptional regulator [Spirochaeta africana]AFG36397.1 transcriptional regulator [Spirochaeta africana DSM 8902]
MSTTKTLHHEQRDTNRLKLLDAAEQLFLQHGIQAVTMQQIAARAGLSRVTLYKHFSGKDELLFAVEIRILQEFHQSGELYTTGADNRSLADVSALIRLEHKLTGYLAYFRRHRHHFRFVGLFDQHYSISYPNQELEQQYRQALSGFSNTVQLLAQGIRDGSMRSDIDPHATSAFIGNVFIATAHRIAAREAILAREHNLDMQVLPVMFCEMVLRSIAADPNYQPDLKRRLS